MADGIEAAPEPQIKQKRLYGRWVRHNAACIEAIRVGASTFDPGEPCKKGHLSPRYTSNGQCAQCRKDLVKAWKNTDAGRASIKASAQKEQHKERVREKQRKRNKTEKYKRISRKYRGIPEPTRPCPKTCECCGNPPGRIALVVDHCHTTNIFRGWLCNRCNIGIGALRDNLAGVQKAVVYLAAFENTLVAQQAVI